MSDAPRGMLESMHAGWAGTAALACKREGLALAVVLASVRPTRSECDGASGISSESRERGSGGGAGPGPQKGHSEELSTL
jgi:hypothetical protein